MGIEKRKKDCINPDSEKGRERKYEAAAALTTRADSFSPFRHFGAAISARQEKQF